MWVVLVVPHQLEGHRPRPADPNQDQPGRGVDGVEGGRELPVGVVNSGVGVNVSVNGDANVRWKGKGRDREVGVS